MKRLLIIPFILFYLCIVPFGTFAAEENNEAQTPEIVMDGKKLTLNEDYTLTYLNNKKIGTATVIVDFIGNYSGKIECNFSIVSPAKGEKHRKGSTSSSNETSVAKPTPTPEAPIIEDDVPDTSQKTNTHYAYISGYEDGSFRPNSVITRAETAVMLSRIFESKPSQSEVGFKDVRSDTWYVDAVSALSSSGIINGYTDGTFRPDNRITRAEFVTMLIQNRQIQHCDDSPFYDVDTEMWSVDYIYSAYMLGYVDGYEDGTFNPDGYITRAEAVKVINCLLGRNDFNITTNPFFDVYDTHWAYKHILEAATQHIAK